MIHEVVPQERSALLTFLYQYWHSHGTGSTLRQMGQFQRELKHMAKLELKAGRAAYAVQRYEAKLRGYQP